MNNKRLFHIIPLNRASCFGSVLLLFGLYAFMPSYSAPQFMEEICDNAVDDDGDGLIDLNDPDCDCPVIAPVSLIPNPSFEAQNCCPTSRSQLNCADTWIQASASTTDYLHTCGWMGWTEFPPPLPFPDGDGVLGLRDGRVRNAGPEVNWKEYAGACLLNPLLANTSYRFQFHVGFVNQEASPPISITFFGTTDCDNLPFGGTNDMFGCPTNGPGWVELGSVLVDAAGANWKLAEINLTPDEDIYAVAIGPPCRRTTASVSTYYFFDNLVLDDVQSFEFRINTEGHPCRDDFALSVPEIPDHTYQWYRNGIALPGETDIRIRPVYGVGEYQVRILSNNDCQVSRQFVYQVPVFREEVSKYLCEGTSYSFGSRQLDLPGTYIDTFQSADNCDSIVTLELLAPGIGEDTLNAFIFEGESYALGDKQFRFAGKYELNFLSSEGCDSLVLLNLDYYRVFIPNVFTPNGDGYNDFFTIFGGEELSAIRRLQVFNRWGDLLYEGEQLVPNQSNGWDGRYKGEALPPGVYVYLAELEMNDGKIRPFSGSLTLVR